MASQNFWRGKKIVITAGPTREALDPVRYLSNASSGRMGYALADAARKNGAAVVLISGPTALPPPRAVRLVPAVSARDMLRVALRHARNAHAVIGTAAVADWRPARPRRHKMKKTGSADELLLRLKKNPDILKTLSHRRRDRRRPLLIGFALETDHLLQNARKKLSEKNLDLIVANAGSALDSPRTSVVLLVPSGILARFRNLSKKTAARRLLTAAARYFERRRP
ncbi:MAG TPA: phosphopantothenoylcysteine decarboxylase [Elusimicrobiota bacterium]|nr:phosphopantothenoylcysteine decarboxylase [Elusimicrobiota bacterium]